VGILIRQNVTRFFNSPENRELLITAVFLAVIHEVMHIVFGIPATEKAKVWRSRASSRLVAGSGNKPIASELVA
jgi:hypothetical protein